MHLTSYSLDFRHFIADLLTELGRLDESRNEFETLIRDYPEDSWAYEGVIESVTHEDAGCWNCVYERQHPARGDFYRRVSSM